MGLMNTQKARARVREIGRELDAVNEERTGLMYGKSAENVTRFDVMREITPALALRVMYLGIKAGKLVAELRKIQSLAHRAKADQQR